VDQGLGEGIGNRELSSNQADRAGRADFSVIEWSGHDQDITQIGKPPGKRAR